MWTTREGGREGHGRRAAMFKLEVMVVEEAVAVAGGRHNVSGGMGHGSGCAGCGGATYYTKLLHPTQSRTLLLCLEMFSPLLIGEPMLPVVLILYYILLLYAVPTSQFEPSVWSTNPLKIGLQWCFSVSFICKLFLKKYRLLFIYLRRFEVTREVVQTRLR